MRVILEKCSEIVERLRLQDGEPTDVVSDRGRRALRDVADFGERRPEIDDRFPGSLPLRRP